MKRYFSGKQLFILLSVFLTGAAVLVVEVTATRILAPYFGNTIYTVSSVISTVLAALSLGYYAGGRVADRHPSRNVFYGIIALGGIFVFILQILSILVLPVIGQTTSLVYGPLLASLILFFFPSFLLGMLSPFAIKLVSSSSPQSGVGKVSGDVFFWSTLGSIFGSLSSGFFLIPQFGISEIIISSGWALVFLGLLGLGIRRTMRLDFFLCIVAAALIFGTLAAYSLFYDVLSLGKLYSKDGVYERIFIYDAIYHGRPARFLMQDHSNSAAEYLDGKDLVFDYTKYYELYKIFNPGAKHILVIGAGAYTIPKAFLNSISNSKVDVVDIEPRLYELAKTYFSLQDDPRMKNYVEDGRRFLSDATSSYDVVFGDVYQTFLSLPAHFTTEEFFRLTKTKLSKDGIFVVNFAGSLAPDNPSLTFSEIRTFQEVFPNNYIFAVATPHTDKAQNFIFVGWNGSRNIDESLMAKESKASDLIKTLGDHIASVNPRFLESYPILTDNYAPVEYLVSGLSRHLSVEDVKSRK